jgi:hypothetical protein
MPIGNPLLDLRPQRRMGAIPLSGRAHAGMSFVRPVAAAEQLSAQAVPLVNSASV